MTGEGARDVGDSPNLKAGVAQGAALEKEMARVLSGSSPKDAQIWSGAVLCAPTAAARKKARRRIAVSMLTNLESLFSASGR